MSEDIKLEFLQAASSCYLSEEIPNNWHEMVGMSQINFIQDHKWDPLAEETNELLWESIEHTAKYLQRRFVLAKDHTEEPKLTKDECINPACPVNKGKVTESKYPGMSELNYREHLHTALQLALATVVNISENDNIYDDKTHTSMPIKDVEILLALPDIIEEEKTLDNLLTSGELKKHFPNECDTIYEAKEALNDRITSFGVELGTTL